MIITLIKADFSDSNIGSSTTWRITKTLKGVTCSNSATTITKGSTYSATFTVTSGYTFSSATVTMGGVDKTSSLVWNNEKTSATLTLATTETSGNIYVTITALSNSGSGNEDETVTYYTLAKGSAYASSTATSASRASISPVTIKIPDGVTITPKDGYAIGVFYGVNPNDSFTGNRCPDKWNLTEWTGNGVTTIGLSIKKSDGTDFSDSDFGKPMSDFVDATDASIWEVKEEVVPTRYTLYAGNWFDDSASSNKMQNRATHNPYTIVVPSGVSITPKSGYMLSVWSGLNKYDIPTPDATYTSWSADAYTGDGSEVGLCIKKSDNSDFDFTTESTYIGDYLDSTDTSIWEVK